MNVFTSLGLAAEAIEKAENFVLTGKTGTIRVM